MWLVTLIKYGYARAGPEADFFFIYFWALLKNFYLDDLDGIGSAYREQDQIQLTPEEIIRERRIGYAIIIILVLFLGKVSKSLLLLETMLTQVFANLLQIIVFISIKVPSAEPREASLAKWWKNYKLFNSFATLQIIGGPGFLSSSLCSR